MARSSADRGRRSHGWGYLLLLLPFIALLAVSTYNRQAPDLGGIPFFYWYQFLWVIVTAAIMVVVFRLTD